MRFSGTSKNGDFQEALHEAILAALGGLGVTLVNWTLVAVSGAYGGVVGQNDLTVEIVASAP